MRMSDDEVRNVLDTNLTSMMLGTKFLLRMGYLRRRPSSRSQQKEKEKENEEGKGDAKGDAKGDERRASPVIINMSSLLGVKGGYGAVAYAASKAGVLGFTRALASEYQGLGVRVNAVVPGYVETEMTKGMSHTHTSYQAQAHNSPLTALFSSTSAADKNSLLDLNAAELETRIPLGRFGTAEEIAHAVLFLAENEYAHNCVVNLDGGLSAV